MSLFDWLFPKKKITVISNGFTTTKISDTVYETHISEEQKQIWDNERWEKDNVIKLLTKEGFHIKSHGRSGSIYYIEQGKMCEVYFEISGVPQYDILPAFSQLKTWKLPNKIPLTKDEKNRIEKELIIWLKDQNIKADIY